MINDRIRPWFSNDAIAAFEEGYDFDTIRQHTIGFRAGQFDGYRVEPDGYGGRLLVSYRATYAGGYPYGTCRTVLARRT